MNELKNIYTDFKWYHKESLKYNAPSGLKGYTKFWIRYPKAITLCLYWSYKSRQDPNFSSSDLDD